MSYKKLKNFKKIIAREDFDYISSIENISRVSEIILYYAPNPDDNENDYIAILDEFYRNLTSFYFWINGMEIPDINDGYLTIRRELIKVINILKTPKSESYKRKAISKGYFKKFNKIFLYGLTRMLEGIRAAFDPSIISNTKIQKGYIARYILDNTEGLGRMFLFNKAGKDSFAAKLRELEREELAATARLLATLPSNQIRTYKGWVDLGTKNAMVRILIKPGTFKRDAVCFLYRNTDTDKPSYLEMLNTPPTKVPLEFV
jgi:hypothetical protein